MPKSKWSPTTVTVDLTNSEIAALVRFKALHQCSVPEEPDNGMCRICYGYHETGTKVTTVPANASGPDLGPICWHCLVHLAEAAGIVEKGLYDDGE